MVCLSQATERSACRSIIAIGTPASGIVQALSDRVLAVVMTVGRTGMSHLFLGSVSEKTVRQARCPVLVARAK